VCSFCPPNFSVRFDTRPAGKDTILPFLSPFLCKMVAPGLLPFPRFDSFLILEEWVKTSVVLFWLIYVSRLPLKNETPSLLLPPLPTVNYLLWIYVPPCSHFTYQSFFFPHMSNFNIKWPRRTITHHHLQLPIFSEKDLLCPLGCLSFSMFTPYTILCPPGKIIRPFSVTHTPHLSIFSTLFS